MNEKPPSEDVGSLRKRLDTIEGIFEVRRKAARAGLIIVGIALLVSAALACINIGPFRILSPFGYELERWYAYPFPPPEPGASEISRVTRDAVEKGLEQTYRLERERARNPPRSTLFGWFGLLALGLISLALGSQLRSRRGVDGTLP